MRSLSFTQNWWHGWNITFTLWFLVNLLWIHYLPAKPMLNGLPAQVMILLQYVAGQQYYIDVYMYYTMVFISIYSAMTVGFMLDISSTIWKKHTWNVLSVSVLRGVLCHKKIALNMFQHRKHLNLQDLLSLKHRTPWFPADFRCFLWIIPPAEPPAGCTEPTWRGKIAGGLWGQIEPCHDLWISMVIRALLEL